MKTFRFALDGVLDVRTAQEAEARQHLATALDRQSAAEARSREAVQALNRLLMVIAAESAGRFSAASRERSWMMRQAQESLCGELRNAAQACARETEVKRVAVLEARRNRELLERLKASRLRLWTGEAALAEQHQFDEFAMTRRHQTAQHELVPC